MAATDELASLDDELHEAARYGDLEDVEELLSLGANVHAVDANASTPLHKAAANGHSSVASALLARGATQCANSAGNSPLHWACMNGHAGVVDVLLAAGGADVYAKNVAGRSAFTEAIAAGHDVLARALLQHASAEPPAAASVVDDEEGGEGAEGGEGGDEDLLEGEAAAAAASAAAAGEGAAAIDDTAGGAFLGGLPAE